MSITNPSMNKAYFMLPGFCEHYELYKYLDQFLKQYPEAKREEAEIYCYYGNIPFCTWDGGRIFFSYQPLSIEQIQELQQFYAHSKIRLVFTNKLLQQKHCFDRYNNIILNLFHDSNNEIVINSEILEQYIVTNYPDYSLVSSTTKCLTNQQQALEEINKPQYKFTCLDYNLNHNWKFLESLSLEEKEKTEFLINPICGPGCSQRSEHYRLNSLFALSYGKPYILKNCEITECSICAEKNPNIISAKELYSIYLPKGFKYFKIEGRSLTSKEVALYCAEYLIKPEYQLLFLRNTLLQNFCK